MKIYNQLKISELLYLIKKYNIPSDAEIEMDSGWECGPVPANDLFYSIGQNKIFITSGSQAEDYLDYPDVIHLKLEETKSLLF